MPKVSVIMPAYNHGKYITEAIESVLAQDFTDFELMIVDDGSTDDTVAMIKRISDSRIKLIEFPVNQSACVAANRAIREAAGEYVAMLSSDDAFLPGKLKRQVDFLDTHPNVLAVFGKAEIVNEIGEPLTDEENYYLHVFEMQNRSNAEWLKHFFYQGNCLCHPSVMIRRSCFEQIGYYDERLALVADLDYWIRICLAGEIFILQDKLIRFRVRDYELNASGQRPETQIRYGMELRQVLKHFAHITDVEKLVSIFPQIAEVQPNQHDVVAFLVAKLALAVDNPIYQCFGIDMLFELLSGPEMAKSIKERYQFGYREFTELSSRYDVFNLVPGTLSKIYLDTGAGFSEQETIAVRINTNIPQFRITVDVNAGKHLKAIRWDPVEGRLARIRIREAYYTTSKGQLQVLEACKISVNGRIDQEGYYAFQTFDPMLIFPVAEQVAQLTLIGDWEFSIVADIEEYLNKKLRALVADNNILYETKQELLDKVTKQAALIEGQETKLQQQNALIQSLLNSFSWRITYPFRFAKKLVFNQN